MDLRYQNANLPTNAEVVTDRFGLGYTAPVNAG